MLDDWKDAFEPHILIRGRKYFQDGLVTDMKASGDDISAYVRGTDYYKVAIHLKNNHIHNAFCSCPYFQGGNNCKHLAALMYAYMGCDAHGEVCSHGNNDIDSDPDCDALYEAIQNADKSQLEKLVLIMADQNPANRAFIAKAFSCAPAAHKSTRIKKKTSDIDLTAFKADAELIFHSYSGRQGFINYHDAYDFECELCDYLTSSTAALIENESFLDAFELTTYVFRKLSNTNIDDDGNISGICDTIRQIWTAIIDKCDEPDHILIRQWFKKHCNDITIIDYMRDYLNDFLKEELLSRDEMQEELNELDAALLKCEYDESYNYYHRLVQVRRRVFLMKKLGANEKEAQAYWFDHDELPEVRDDLLKYNHSIGNYREEIRLIVKYRNNTKGTYEQDKYTQKLAMLYHLINDKASEKKEIKHLTNIRKRCDMDLFKSYKALCTAKEWEKERDRIIDGEQDPTQKCLFLSEEKLYERLFEVIEHSRLVSLYNKYGFTLEKYYTPQILRFYKTYVEEFAMDARNPARYRELSSYLQRMQQYEGGQKMVRELAADLGQKFPTRKQMVQMLNGFI